MNIMSHYLRFYFVVLGERIIILHWDWPNETVTLYIRKRESNVNKAEYDRQSILWTTSLVKFSTFRWSWTWLSLMLLVCMSFWRSWKERDSQTGQQIPRRMPLTCLGKQISSNQLLPLIKLFNGLAGSTYWRNQRRDQVTPPAKALAIKREVGSQGLGTKIFQRVF